MNWEALGAIGEIVGAIAVILTLLYLATQLKQNSASTRAATYSSTTDGWHTYLQTQTVEDLELIIQLASDHGSLTNAEFYRAYYLCRTLFRRMEHDYFQFCAGTFDSETWNAYVISFQKDTFNNAGVRVMWRLQSEFVSPAFRRYMQPYIDAASNSRQLNLRKQFDQLMQEGEGT